MFFRKITTKKNGKEYVYVKLIENYRQDGKVKQRVVANFGSIENLSSDRLNYLIASLKKLHREIENPPNEAKASQQAISLIQEIRQALGISRLRQSLLQVLDEPTYTIAEALLVKALAAGDVNKPVQEICKGLGLLETTSLKFYNTMRRLGGENIKESLLKNRLREMSSAQADQPILIHVLKSQFVGGTFEVDITNNVYLPQNYQKEFILLLACDAKGQALDFAYAEESEEVAEQLGLLLGRLRGHLSNVILVLDEVNCVQPSDQYLLGKMVESPPEDKQEICMQVVSHRRVNESQLKELKAKLAKVSAGMENIKADILLGKLTRESVVRKRAEQVIKHNNCEDLVTYSFDENTHTFAYQIEQDTLQQRQQSTILTNWIIERDPASVTLAALQSLEIKKDQFYIITDQLNIPPINLYVDYHYSPEIISGHVQTEIIKQQILNTMNTSYQGGDA